jgi:hypothetical protein
MKSSTPETTGVARLNYHGGVTRVYVADHSPIFHADLRCHELRDVAQVAMLPLGHVLTTDTNPRKPCDHCTCDLAHTIHIATTYDGTDPTEIVYTATEDH